MRSMTDPGSATGMSYGDDYVAARLSIEVPQDGAEGLRGKGGVIECEKMNAQRSCNPFCNT